MCAVFGRRNFSGTLGTASVKYLILGHNANRCSGLNHFSDHRDPGSRLISTKKPSIRSYLHDLTKPFILCVFPHIRTFVPGERALCVSINALHSPISSKLPSTTCTERLPDRRATETSSEQRCPRKNLRHCMAP
jgi:hypothetical protein